MAEQRVERETEAFLSQSPDMDTAASETVGAMVATCDPKGLLLSPSVVDLLRASFIAGACWEKTRDLDRLAARMPAEGNA